MAQELCAICHERPAVARVSLVQNGQRRELALCELHYRQLMRQQRMRSPLESLFGGGSPFDEIFSGFGEQSPVTPVRAREPEAVDIAEYFSKQTTEYLQRAAQVAAEFGKREVDTEHLLYALADADVVQAVLKQFGLSPADLKQYIEANAVRGASKGEASEDMTISPRVKSALQHAFALSRELGHSYVGPEHLLLGLAAVPDSFAGTLLKKYGLTEQALRQKAVKVVGKGAEDGRVDGPSNTPQLDKFSRDLTRLAREGKLDPVIGRSKEVETTIEVLARRKKNNPVLIGEPGVGKTAIVEGLASRIAAGEVPPALRDVELLSLDMGLLQAGASVKGEFERRLKGVIDEVKAAPRPTILFIDEAHTLIGAGGQAGGSDAANLLKPALARGELRTIAATTWAEYKKYFEKDPALARRFQPVQLHEPSVAEAVTILRGLARVYEESHGIYLRDDAVVAAAELSARYLAGRQLPDKAVDVLDTACARVRISLAAAPESLERLRGELAEGERQRQALRRDAEAGLPIDHDALQALEERLAQAESERHVQEDQWSRQRELAERLLALRQQLARAREANREEQGSEADAEAFPADEHGGVEALEKALHETRQALADAQAQGRLVSFEVCPRLVAEVIGAWTGVPVEQLAREHNAKVMGFADDLRARIRGQEQAVSALDRAMRATAAGLNKPDAPVGVFLLVGPSGVGKTETALALADLLYGGERFITTINMSEFQEKHTVSRLIGAPPGYVGYGEGGMLTEAVRQKPYSVILLDEVEKADPDVLNLFYQIFDKGVANDGEGREIDFRNTLILMTSKIGRAHV